MGGIEKGLADGAYQGEIEARLEAAHQCVLEIVPRSGEGFVVAPWRWVVEITLSWLDKSRQLCRDYEELLENHERAVYISMIRLILRRLTDNQQWRAKKTPSRT